MVRQDNNDRCKKIIWLLLVIIVVEMFIICVQRGTISDYVESNASKSTNIIDLRYEDTFNTIPVVDIEGNKTNMRYGEKNTLLFYLSSACTSCGDVLRFCNRLQRVLGEDNLQVLLLWCDSIPVSLVNEYNILYSNCYRTDDMTTLNTPTPTAYILDNQGNILYYNSDISKTIEKLYTQIVEIQDNVELLRIRANDYLREVYNISDFKKQQVIFFAMTGCPDCIAADEILQDVKEKKDIYYLYKYDDMDTSHFKDDYALFRLIYGIDWYPSFLVFQSEKDYKIIGEVPVDTLVNVLDKW